MMRLDTRFVKTSESAMCEDGWIAEAGQNVRCQAILVAAQAEQEGVLVPADCIARIRSLTPQQRRVFDLLSEGLSNKQIALRLDVHESTVKAHASAVFAKLGCNSRIKVALLALRCSLVRQDESDYPTK